MRGVRAASSSGLRACDGLGERAVVDGAVVDGLDPETGWIDEEIWARMSQDDRWRHYELVQKMLWKKFEEETPPPPDEGATAEEKWQRDDQQYQQNPKEKKPQQGFSISEMDKLGFQKPHEVELFEQIQKYVESKVGGAWYEYDELVKNHADLRQQLKHDAPDELHDLAIDIQKMAVALVDKKKDDLTAMYSMAKKYDELKKELEKTA